MPTVNRIYCRRTVGRCLSLLVCLSATGCVSPWWNAFLSPHELGNFRENRVNEIQRSISFRDRPLGIPGAADPTPDDLVALVEEYRFGPGDMLSIRLLDFIAIGAESELTPTVDELGYIDMPQLGWLHVEGMTPRQLQAELIQRAREAGIYPPDTLPTVLVTAVGRQQRVYNISGSIAAPGPYPVFRPDFRLREAINQAGGLADMVKTIYIFRNEPRETRLSDVSIPSADRGTPAPRDDSAPPVTPWMSDLSQSAGSGQPAEGPKEAAEPGQREPGAPALAVPADEVERDLQEALSPTAAPSESPDSPPAPAPAIPTYIYVNDNFVEAPPAATQSVPATTPLPYSPAVPTARVMESVDWEDIAAEGQQRVIRIPAEKLRNGDPNFNIVVRHQDWVQLDAGEVGVFYMMGHVMRPGVYSLTGQEITLTQAIAAAGGLDQLAWPTRCEIRRRIDGDREEITQWDLSRIVGGQDPDLFVKKEDVVTVGTHAVAPLLATIRNSFRLSYGFGFVYDRNFADIDAYYVQQNPRDRRRNERALRGLLP